MSAVFDNAVGSSASLCSAFNKCTVTARTEAESKNTVVFVFLTRSVDDLLSIFDYTISQNEDTLLQIARIKSLRCH